MDSKIASETRNDFSKRLHEALASAGCSATPTAFAREFNPRADGASITIHGARKWLMGESFPTQERLTILARWLNVSAQWLRFGEGEKQADTAANDPARLPLDHVLLINDFERLDERSKAVVRDMLASLLKHHSLRT